MKKLLDENEVVIIDDDSDDDNNNAESSPDRHQAAENDHSFRDSDETERREDSTSNDVAIVGVVEARPDEIEEISRITSQGKLFEIENFWSSNFIFVTFAVKLALTDKVNESNFERLKLLGTGAYGRVYLVRKKDGIDRGRLYAMKVLEKSKVTQKKKTTEHTRTEREVSEDTDDAAIVANSSFFFRCWRKLLTVHSLRPCIMPFKR